MRTSNKLLLSVFLVFVIGLGIYNMGLKAEYDKKEYEKPYYNYKALTFKDFDEVQVNAANMIHVVIEQGDFGAYQAYYDQEPIKFSQVGKRLIIDIDYKQRPIDTINVDRLYNEVIIKCPRLASVITDGYYLVNGKVPGIEAFKTDKDWKPQNATFSNSFVELNKFKMDSLLIQQNAGAVYMHNNSINTLKVNTGPTASALLEIETNNNIQKADLDINGTSNLILRRGLYVPQLNYRIGKMAQLTVSGAMLNGQH